MSSSISDNFDKLAKSGELTATTILDQMAEDRKTAPDYDPGDYDSMIEAAAAWWCLRPENRDYVLGLPKTDQVRIATAILSETAWGHLFSRDFEPDGFDFFVELSSSQEVLMSGIEIAGKDGWIEWALAHFDKKQVRTIIFRCLQTQPETAKAFFGSIGGGWNPTFWGLFDTVPLFLTAIKAVTPQVPSRVIGCWSQIGAYLTKIGSGQSLDAAKHSWDFLPTDGKDARRLAKPSMGQVMDILREAFVALRKDDWIHVRSLRYFPIDFRLTAFGYVQRLDEGIEFAIDLLFDLPREDERSQVVLERFLGSMTEANAPLFYVHTLACRMEKGDTIYVRHEKIRGGRHHASRGQRGLWQSPMEDRKEVLLKSLVRNAWFYPELHQRLRECGWKTASRDELRHPNYDGGRLGDYYAEFDRKHGTRHVLHVDFLAPEDNLQWLQLSSKCDMLVPTRPWRKPDDVQEIGTDAIYSGFRTVLPIFDSPLRMDLYAHMEKEALKSEENRQERRRNRRSGGRRW